MLEFSLSAVFPSLPQTTRGSAVVLGNTPSGENILYCNGTSVYTIPLDNRLIADIYTEHSYKTTVAKISPSGFYCASGDIKGNVRIWDTTQSTHILKHTIPVLSGPVKDIAWDSESKRIAAVGEGAERFGHVFLLDTTTSNGSLTGQSRPINSVDFKPTRPFRIVTGSDDYTVAIFEGPPFKFKNIFHQHNKFVHSIRFSPDGSLFASTGSDGTIVLYNGVDGSKVAILEEKDGRAHFGSVFGLSWSPDGSRIASASADKTAKIWNVSSRRLERTIVVGTKADNQQLGIVWTKKALISVSANGFLNILNPDEGVVTQTRRGHNKGITALAKSADGTFLYSADADGHVNRWNISSGESSRFSPHSTIIIGLSESSSGEIVTVSWDDTVKWTVISSQNFIETKSCSLKSQPCGLEVSEDIIVIASCKHLNVLYRSESSPAIEVDISYHPTCLSLFAKENVIAVGGKDATVHVYKVHENTLEELKTIDCSAEVTGVSFSDDGKYLAITDLNRKVIPYFVANFSVASPCSWTFHTAKVLSLAWSPDCSRLATGSIDNSIIIWDIKKPSEHPIIIKGAHAMSSVNVVLWLNETTVVSAGQDSNIKIWNVPA